MPSKDGWTQVRDHEKITLGRKTYRNMEEWSRPCAACGAPFEIFVRTNAGMVNSSFGLRTCKEHRGQKPAPGTSTPLNEEFQRVMMANKIMQEELDGLYARLAKYELPAAMREAAKKMPWE